MRKKKICVTGAAAVLLLSGCLLISVNEALAGTLPSGFSVAGMSLTGMTGEEAGQKINEQIAEQSNQKITLMLDGNAVTVTAAELGFFWSNQEELEQAAKQYAGGNLLRRYLNQKNLEENPVDLKPETAVDEEKLLALADSRLSEYIKPAQDAVIVKTESGFEVTGSVAGQRIDQEATKQAVEQALSGGLAEPVTVQVVLMPMEPERTTEQLLTIQDKLGSFSTTFSAGNRSRTKNLTTGAGKINGTVLMPGEEFSAYTWLAPFTLENGYASAGTYANGQVVDSVGGGACQICTTLYNAALLAELEITQRQNHSMVVGYVRPSQDAAIAGTVKDLKFKNSYETPIYLEGLVNGGTLTFTIYGQETRPANREIQFVSETVSTKDPGEPVRKVDASLAPGAQVKVQSAHTGLQSRLWKYVYVDGVETEKTLLHSDSYMASKAIYRVGPEAPAADPNQEVDPNPAVDPNQGETAETAPSVEPVPVGPGAEAQTPAVPAGEAMQAAEPAPETAPVFSAPSAEGDVS